MCDPVVPNGCPGLFLLAPFGHTLEAISTILAPFWYTGAPLLRPLPHLGGHPGTGGRICIKIFDFVVHVDISEIFFRGDKRRNHLEGAQWPSGPIR